MRNRSIIGVVTRWISLYGWQHSVFSSSSRRLLAAAALLHVMLAVGLFWAGRAQVAPAIIDRDGIMGSFAFDSYEYQRGAVQLAEMLRQENFKAWVSRRAPLHVKLLSVEFALIGPLLGYGTLSAEPINLLCYLAIVALVLALGREVGGERVGILSAGAVALWPTFLLHTLQLLKDSLFIAGALVFILCVTTWLTRTYNRSGAIKAGAVMTAVIALILFIRLDFGVVILSLALLGFALLIVRQLCQKRLLIWNMACPLLLLLGAGALTPFFATRHIQRFKSCPSDQIGQLKSVAGDGVQIATIVSDLSPIRPVNRAPLPFAEPFYTATDSLARKVSSVRTRFAAVYSNAGSGIDGDVEFRNSTDLILYLPRAFEIGCWAPFPNTWFAAGRRVGSAGRLLSGAETLVMYMCQLLALLEVLRKPRSLSRWLLLSATALGMTVLGLVVPNVGALYRFRYTFWILLIILGVKGFERVITSFVSWLRRRRGMRTGRPTTVILLACLLTTTCSGSSRTDSTDGADAVSHTQGISSAVITAQEEDISGNLGIALVNSTGATLRAIYLSPSDSQGWEENIVAGGELADGDTVDIRFSCEARSVRWDLRIDAVDGHYAEWKDLNISGISSIRLLLRINEEPVAVAEVE